MKEYVILSIQPIVNLLEKLIQEHEELLKLSKQKTDEIKEGQTDKLQATLIKERKVIQSIERTEEKRMEEVNKWFTDQGLPLENATITEMLNKLSNENEKKSLEKVTVNLTELIVKIKQQEQLNEALLKQSMQFVQLSLDMLHPSIENMNYNQKQSQVTTERSVFDSKA